MDFTQVLGLFGENSRIIKYVYARIDFLTFCLIFVSLVNVYRSNFLWG